jgi:hypothetical protein
VNVPFLILRSLSDHGYPSEAYEIYSPVRISANNASEVGVVGLGVCQVLLWVVVSNRNVLPFAIAVMHPQIGESGTIRNERCLDPLSLKIVLLEGIA